MRTSDDLATSGTTTGGFSIRRCLNTAVDTFLTNIWGWLGYGIIAILFPPPTLRNEDSEGGSANAETVTGAVINGAISTALFALGFTFIIRAALRDTAGDRDNTDREYGNAFPVLLLIGTAFLTVQAAAIHVAGLLGPEWALIDGPWYFRLRLTALIIAAVSVLLLPFVRSPRSATPRARRSAGPSQGASPRAGRTISGSSRCCSSASGSSWPVRSRSGWGAWSRSRWQSSPSPPHTEP
ncbi:hypothetical protein ACFOX2_07645 [Corynebacterium marambiense]|uniref:hypothetical protein n=1 Tax=Corynebacterium marambiense TaxID=2765364 RepID=UPI003610507C